jgi:hypothetical protein
MEIHWKIQRDWEALFVVPTMPGKCDVISIIQCIVWNWMRQEYHSMTGRQASSPISPVSGFPLRHKGHTAAPRHTAEKEKSLGKLTQALDLLRGSDSMVPQNAGIHCGSGNLLYSWIPFIFYSIFLYGKNCHFKILPLQYKSQK